MTTAPHSVRGVARCIVFAAFFLATASILRAQSPAIPASQAIRYHDSDNSQGSDPHFDDSAWPVARQGQWPAPLFDSDGFVWVRTTVAIPKDASQALALRLKLVGAHAAAVEIFLNGRSVGREGGFPPGGVPEYLPPSAVFVLPPGTADPGSTAVVALRAWYMPRSRRTFTVFHATAGTLEVGGTSYATSMELAVGPAPALREIDRADRLSEVLGSVPDLALNSLLGLVGLALIIFWRWTRRAELGWCAAVLISYPLYEFFFVATDLGYLSIGNREWGFLFILSTIPGMFTTVEFIRTVHGLEGRAWRWAAHACWILFNLANLGAFLALYPSPGPWAALLTATWTVQLFNLLTLGANLWVLFVRRYNRLIAAAMSIIPAASAMKHLGFREDWMVGYTDISLFNLGAVVSGLAIAAMLVQRAVAAWKQSQHLQVEFEAAREVQERLVTPPPHVPGFRIDSVYAPATHVGGDFYAIRPLDAGGLQIVVGDVSGKGLRAAMTVSAIIGALRAMPRLTPTRVLIDLNRSLAGSVGQGFVTCCVAQIAADGQLTIANAGHLPPYRNGEELVLPSGLPLGITADAAYTESTLHLAPGDTLTFLSDGVVEAQNATGELFGFDRARQISGESAASIARAAQQHGQSDDITVLTLQFAPAEVAVR